MAWPNRKSAKILDEIIVTAAKEATDAASSADADDWEAVRNAAILCRANSFHGKHGSTTDAKKHDHVKDGHGHVGNKKPKDCLKSLQHPE